jgi:hypothetical protein
LSTASHAENFTFRHTDRPAAQVPRVFTKKRELVWARPVRLLSDPEISKISLGEDAKGREQEVHRTPSLPSPKQVKCRERQHGVLNVLPVDAKLRDGSLRSYGPSGFGL